METVALKFELLDDEAWVLALLAKRVTWNELRANAVDDDEASLMIRAVGRLAEELARVGYMPR